jgi:hypothetical protein
LGIVVIVLLFVVVVSDVGEVFNGRRRRAVRVEVNKFSKKKEKLTGERRWQMKRRSKPYTSVFQTPIVRAQSTATSSVTVFYINKKSSTSAISTRPLLDASNTKQ